MGKNLSKPPQCPDFDTFRPFSLDGLHTYVWIIGVYDGDTVTAGFNFRGQPTSFRCRCLGYDSPELRTKDLDEKRRGEAARDFLREMIFNKSVLAEFGKADKYGRPLINIIVNNRSLSVIMIENGHGKEYYGGKKS